MWPLNTNLCVIYSYTVNYKINRYVGYYVLHGAVVIQIVYPKLKAKYPVHLGGSVQ
jgi:hypothetical protein